MDLKNNFVNVWFDEWEIKVGDSITQKISSGIQESSWLAIVLSNSSISSSWVQKELGSGLTRELYEKCVFVLPILKEECEIPMLLRDKKYADFRSNYSHGLHELLTVVVPEINVEEDSLNRDRLHSLLLPAVRAEMPVRVIDLQKMQETLIALQDFLGYVDITFTPVRAESPLTAQLLNEMYDVAEQYCHRAGIKTHWSHFPVKSGDVVTEGLFNELLGTINQVIWHVLRRDNLI